MPQQFNRSGYTELWITLSSNEVLGILDSGYLEDYDGTDGQVSLYHAATSTRLAVPMNELTEETPGIPHDVFSGFVTLAGLSDGLWAVQGRVRDVAGNYTILGAVANPLGGEQVIALEIEVTGGVSGLVRLVRNLAGAAIRPGLTLVAPASKAASISAAAVAATALTLLTPKALSAKAATAAALALKTPV